MDKITLKNLSFYAYHGLLPEEQELGQQFRIDIEIYLDLRKAGIDDNLDQGVSYVDIYRLVEDNCKNQRFKLIEGLAEKICEEILSFSPKIEQVVTRVRKPQAPVAGIFDYFEVELCRTR